MHLSSHSVNCLSDGYSDEASVLPYGACGLGQTIFFYYEYSPKVVANGWLFRFVLISYDIVGKPGTGIYSSLMTPMLNLVRYVSWRKGLPACLSWFFVLVYTSIVVVYL